MPGAIDVVNWLWFADLSYRMRTTGSYFDGSKYKFGDAILWSGHDQYRPLATLALDLVTDKVTPAKRAGTRRAG
jgi:hypothetical protein